MSIHFAALDCGTTTVKAGIIDLKGNFKGYSGASILEEPSTSNRHELSVELLRETAFQTLRKAVVESKVNSKEIEAICITGQRASFLALDKNFTPLGNIISWQDGRGGNEIIDLEQKLDSKTFRNITGLPLNPVFTLGKLLWFLKNEQDKAKKVSKILTVPDYLSFCLGVKEPTSDYSNASLTGMFNIAKFEWSKLILDTAAIPVSLLPRTVSPGTQTGFVSTKAAEKTGLLSGTPIIAGSGDQQCAGLGAGAIEPGIVEIALGTCGVPLMALKDFPDNFEEGLMYCCHAAPKLYEVEGFQNSAGSAFAWANRILKKFDSKNLIIDKSYLPGDHNILFLPYLSGGSSAPYWNPSANGVFMGLTLEHNPKDLGKAVFEGVIIQTAQIVEIFRSSGIKIDELRLTGSCSSNPLVQNLMAGFSELPVKVMKNPESGLIGASLLASLGIKAFPDLPEAIESMVQITPTDEISDDFANACLKLKSIYQNITAAFQNNDLFSTWEEKNIAQSL
ncbi:MAG: xylulokinase [Candidatus Rifleibacteriota bacterium]